MDCLRRRLGLALALLAFVVVPLNADDEYPTLSISNESLTVNLYLPDSEQGYYRGPRFDWSGVIKSVEMRGHKFYGPLHADHDPEIHDSIGGPAEEFAMNNPMGFAEAKAGEPFVKIGVGLLKKGKEQQYRFDAQYQLMQPGVWQVTHGKDWVEFEQQLDGGRGWAYDYKKRIEILEGQSSFVINHWLKNAGSKFIDINHYNHNFTRIDDTPYGIDYTVEFPFSTYKNNNINDIAKYHDNILEVVKPLHDRALWLNVYAKPGPSEFNAGLIRNNKTGAAVRFKGDAPISKYVFWAVERAACPEPFISIQLMPDEIKEWAISYEFTVDGQSDE